MSIPEYQPTPNRRLFPIWTPKDFQRLAQHTKRFASLAVIQHQPMLPKEDGDALEDAVAQLFELADIAPVVIP